MESKKMPGEFDEIKQELTKFVKERNWEKFHTLKDLSLALCIECGELSEHFLWKSLQESEEHVKDDKKLESVLEEIADVMIYCINLVNAIEKITEKEIAIKNMIMKKINKNSVKYPADLYRNIARLEKMKSNENY
ncbi:MAG: nucleotide pyrophosphohydrolase [Promethearchaeota archaeon]